ncbi:MAG: hypothetical protein U5L11_10115 [Arhodomonas sp.]|nr:hypothetical protein [Arhodomonas sp.]
MDQAFNTGLAVHRRPADACARSSPCVQEVYAGKIGSEYMHITDTAQKRWIAGAPRAPAGPGRAGCRAAASGCCSG